VEGGGVFSLIFGSGREYSEEMFFFCFVQMYVLFQKEIHEDSLLTPFF